MFENLKNTVNTYYDSTIKEFAEKLENMTAETALASWCYTDTMTPKAKELVKACKPSDKLPEMAKAKMLTRYTKTQNQYRAAKLAKLEKAENAAPFVDAEIIVEWTNCRAYGNKSAKAKVICGMVETNGFASGAGYDKESAAIAEAINSNPAIMALLYAHAENGGKFNYSVYETAGLPWFNGGCGVSCFRNVFKPLGYEWAFVSGTENFSVYTLKKAEV